MITETKCELKAQRFFQNVSQTNLEELLKFVNENDITIFTISESQDSYNDSVYTLFYYEKSLTNKK